MKTTYKGIDDEVTPMSGTQTELQEAQEAAEAEPAYSQTLEDGTVVTSEDMDVSDMDISVSMVEEAAPQVEEMAVEAVTLRPPTAPSSPPFRWRTSCPLPWV